MQLSTVVFVILLSLFSLSIVLMLTTDRPFISRFEAADSKFHFNARNISYFHLRSQFKQRWLAMFQIEDPSNLPHPSDSSIGEARRILQRCGVEDFKFIDVWLITSEGNSTSWGTFYE